MPAAWAGTKRTPAFGMANHDLYMIARGCSPVGMWLLLLAGPLVATAEIAEVAAVDLANLFQNDFFSGIHVRDEQPKGKGDGKGVLAEETKGQDVPPPGCEGWWMDGPGVAPALRNHGTVGVNLGLLAGLGLPGRIGRFAVALNLAGRVQSQPTDPFGGGRPFWFHHACTELATLQAKPEGSVWGKLWPISFTWSRSCSMDVLGWRRTIPGPCLC